MATPTRLVLAVPADARSLPAVRGAVRQWLRLAGPGHITGNDIVLATWEACANAVEHPRSPEHSEIYVEAVATRRGVTVVVRDTGRWRESSRRPRRGLGLTLMRALMDDVTVVRTDRGTEIRMCRNA